MLDTLKSVLEEQIKDLYSAENQLLKALPRMAKAAESSALRDAFNAHLKQTEVHAERISNIAALLEMKPGGKKCKAMEGLIKEGEEALKEDGEPTMIDIALVAAAQRVEHYEISAYGTARALAEHLGESTVVQLLQRTLDEEAAADKILTGICTSKLLPAAAGAGGGAAAPKRK